MPSALLRLKAETADLHALAEHYVPILDPGATPADYARHVRAMLGFQTPVEEMLTELAAVGLGPVRRGRAALLRRDLAALGDAGPWPICARLPAGGSTARLIGVAYVVEGAALGARWVLAHLAPALAPLRGRATAHLEGAGTETGARWREFGAVAERELATDPACDAAVAGARDAFACLIDWLAEWERPDARRARRSA